MKKEVLILMGSYNDFNDNVWPACEILQEFNIGWDAFVASAHRTPERVVKMVSEAKANGYKVIICAAGGAAHLAGVAAAHTCLPVVAIPVTTLVAGGLDSLLSMAQMPGDIPVGCMGTSKSGGAKNAGLFAARIIGVTDARVNECLRDYNGTLRGRTDRNNEMLQTLIRERTT